MRIVLSLGLMVSALALIGCSSNCCGTCGGGCGGRGVAPQSAPVMTAPAPAAKPAPAAAACGAGGKACG